MKRFVFILSLLFGSSLIAQADIQFHHETWKEVLAQAKKEKKLVFVDAYTTWCSPCKWMAAKVFTDPRVADFFNAHFINAKIDMEHDEGPELAERYHVRAYPTLLFIAGSGELVHFIEGAMDAERFLALGNEVIDPKFVSIPLAKAEFEAHHDDRHAQANFIAKLAPTYENIDDVVQIFRPGMAGAALLEPDNWAVFQAWFKGIDSDEARYFIAHRQEFLAKYGATEVQAKLLQIYMTTMERAVFKQNAEQFQAAHQGLLASGHPEAEKMALFQELEWYGATGEWAKFIATAYKVDAKAPDMMPVGLNRMASMFLIGATEEKDLIKALEWSRRACAPEPSYFYLATQFEILAKLGRKTEAIAIGQEAIRVAKLHKDPYGGTEDALNELLGQ